MITEPGFYAAAVPAVLLMGLAKSGVGAGFGSLAVPLMALAVPVPQAAAIMLPLLAIMDAIGLRALVGQVDRSQIRLLVPAGLLGVAVGWLMFGLLPAKLVAAVVGAITLFVLLVRRVFPARADAPPPPRWLGALLGAVSGFTSFVAHAGGPPLSFYVLPLRLAPTVFAATTAVFFAVVNTAKWLPYAGLGLIDLTNMSTSLMLAPVAPLGVWVGLRYLRRIPARLFYQLFDAGLLVTGVKLLWDGLR